MANIAADIGVMCTVVGITYVGNFEAEKNPCDERGKLLKICTCRVLI